MRPWRMTRRLIGILAVLIGGLWLVGTAIAAISIGHELDEIFDSALQETAERILPLALNDIAARSDEVEEEQLPNPFPSTVYREHLYYQVRDRAGRVILRSHDAPAEAFRVPLIEGFSDHDGRRYFTQAAADKSLYVQVAELPEERKEAARSLWLGLATPLIALLPMAALAVYWTVQRTTRPILEVKHEISKRDGENLEPIEAHGLPEELTPIIHDINRLLERLKAALEAERSFAANSAHELRTPIAAARAQAELIAAGLRGSPDHARATKLISTLGKLGRRVEKILQLARAEAGVGLARTETDLAAITHLIVEDYLRRPQLASRLSFGVRDSGQIASIDPDALGIALQNLIDNALSHGSADGRVEIVVGPGATVHVINVGPSIAKEELAILKRRFERGGRGSGTGLGLAIVEEIMRQAGGRLDLSSPAPGRSDGFEATLVFAAHQPSPSGQAAAPHISRDRVC
jgi:two-component system OmpR family sensor kinase